MATVPTPTESRSSESRSSGVRPSGVRSPDVRSPIAGSTPGSPADCGGWAFYAVVGTSVQGGHTLARFGPERTALDALRLAVQSVNHTAYSMLEQGVPGDPCADARLLERLPITDFSIERRRSDTGEPDATWGLSGGRHQRRRRAA